MNHKTCIIPIRPSVLAFFFCWIFLNTSLAQNGKIQIPKILHATPKFMDSIMSIQSHYGEEPQFYQCEQCEEHLLSLINKYRTNNNLKLLLSSNRLDSLAQQIAFYNAVNSTLTHYSKIQAMQPVKDLLNAENIARTIMDRNSPDLQVVSVEVFAIWQKSKYHNQNMLIESHDQAGVSVLMKTWINSGLWLEIYAVFESDFHVSKRELNQKYDELNKKIWDAKKFKKNGTSD